MEHESQTTISFIERITADPVGVLNSILYSPELILVQAASLVLSIILFVWWVKLLRKTGLVRMQFLQVREAFTETPVPKAKVLLKWKSVQKRLNSNDEAQWKLAIIEADAILDELIKALGYSGNTMGERMKKIKPQQFPYLDDAWRVHKVRNFIAHDPTYRLKRDAVERALEIYRKIFDHFHVLE